MSSMCMPQFLQHNQIEKSLILCVIILSDMFLQKLSLFPCQHLLLLSIQIDIIQSVQLQITTKVQ